MTVADLLRLFALVGVLFAGIISPSGGYSILILTALSIASLETTAAVTLRNIVVIYHFLVLGVGPYVIGLSDPDRVHSFGVILLASFLCGISARYIFRRPPEPGVGASEDGPVVTTPVTERGHRGEGLLKMAITMQIALIVLNAAQYGIVNFLSGASLAGDISTFAEAGGLTNTQISVLAGQVLMASFVASYVVINEPERRYNWRLLILLLVILPLVGLQRGAVFVNILVILFLYRWTTQARPKRVARHTAVIAASLLVALAAGMGVGLLRAGALSPADSRQLATNAILQGEMSPVIVIDDALAPGAPRFHGSGLYAPLLLRYVPQRLYPDRPANTTTQYMQIKDPASFAAGYSLATTAVGGIILNYGTFPVYGLAAVIGFIFGGRDRPNPHRVGYVCLLYYCVFSLVRNDPVNAVSYFFVMLVGYWITMWVYGRVSGPSHTVPVLNPGPS